MPSSLQRPGWIPTLRSAIEYRSFFGARLSQAQQPRRGMTTETFRLFLAVGPAAAEGRSSASHRRAPGKLLRKVFSLFLQAAISVFATCSFGAGFPSDLPEC